MKLRNFARRSAFSRSKARQSIVGLVSGAFFAVSAIAAAQPVEARNIGEMIDLQLTYDFYLGGLPVAVAKVQASIEDDRYNAATALKTVGVVGFFFDTEFVSSVAGQRMQGNALAPSLFKMRWRTSKEHQNVRMPYNGDAPGIVEAEPPFRKKTYEIDPTEQSGALDPMTAIVAGLLPQSVSNLCDRVIPIFDARRRYDVKFTGQIDDRLEDGKRIVECDGEYTRVAGFKNKMMEKPTYPFKIRFAVEEDGTATALRIWGGTAFGAAVATLRQN